LSSLSSSYSFVLHLTLSQSHWVLWTMLTCLLQRMTMVARSTVASQISGNGMFCWSCLCAILTIFFIHNALFVVDFLNCFIEPSMKSMLEEE
jgi:L-cystine uptake protein TcyP (sodium:dicarboxylate symporter family)